MTLNGEMALILHYFTEFVYDVVVKQLLGLSRFRFQVAQTVFGWKDTNLKFDIDTVVEKSPGPDSIHPLLLKECASVVAKPLSMIFQQSYDTGTLPDEWKTAHIVPIFKKGNRTDPANYRPVSLTSVPCKVMETIIKENHMKFWESNDIFVKDNTASPGGDHVLPIY